MINHGLITVKLKEKLCVVFRGFKVYRYRQQFADYDTVRVRGFVAVNCKTLSDLLLGFMLKYNLLYFNLILIKLIFTKAFLPFLL